MRQLTRNNKVAVILSDSEEGWFTQHQNLELIFLPELVELIESDIYNRNNHSTSYCKFKCNLVRELLTKVGYVINQDTYGDFYYVKDMTVKYITAASDLKIKWVEVGSVFTIDIHERNFGEEVEYIRYQDTNIWITV